MPLPAAGRRTNNLSMPHPYSATPLTPVPEFIDPVLAKTSRKRSFSITENERFGLVFAKTGSINSGTEGCRASNFIQTHYQCKILL
jgi:hypothetical protein